MKRFGGFLGTIDFMNTFDSTCWTVIRDAAAGAVPARDDFARRYGAVVRAYLGNRWRNSPCLGELDDAVQEVFVECFRQGGVLERVHRGGVSGFRGFLYGVVRNVARRVETRRARRREHPAPSGFEANAVEGDETRLSRLFDRAWAKALLRQAALLQEQQAAVLGQEARRRVELLRHRFEDDLPIREIAERWQTDAASLHREYAKARREFKAALVEVVAFHAPGSSQQVEKECTELLALLA